MLKKLETTAHDLLLLCWLQTNLWQAWLLHYTGKLFFVRLLIMETDFYTVLSVLHL